MAKPKETKSRVSELGSHTGFWLRYVSNHVSYAFARKLLASNVTVAEWVMLREMFGRAAVAPSVLAEATGLTRGAVSKLVDRLVQKKLVTRGERSGDRRFQHVELSANGRRMVPVLASIADQNDEDFFSELSSRERGELIAVLKKLVEIHGLSTIPVK